MSGYRFGQNSEEKLEGVHPLLVNLARTALSVSTIDFGISEGLRGIKKQRKLYNAGLTRTMKSQHLTGRAIDIVCIEDGRAVWDAPPYKKAAAAFQLAAEQYTEGLAEANLELVWGGCWQPICGAIDAETLCSEYIRRCKDEGRQPFLDFVHYELRQRDGPVA